MIPTVVIGGGQAGLAVGYASATLIAVGRSAKATVQERLTYRQEPG